MFTVVTESEATQFSSLQQSPD